jgi:RecJ-like exonuclease
VQLETDGLVVLEDDERTTVEDRLTDALDAEARPDAVDLIADDDAVAAVSDSLIEAATAIRRAVMQDRPVVVRHTASADGYVGAVAIERATLPLVEEYHAADDAVYHYFDRRPLEDGVYDMADATKDVTTMLDNSERHGEKLPLFVFVAAGGTRESVDGFELLDVYDADAVVVDDVAVDEAVTEAVETTVTPSADDVAGTTATALAANVAVHVNENVRGELRHLPAVSYWDDTPERYVDAAADAGYDATETRDVRQAIALEAYYQSYEDKRELIADLLFASEGEHGLATHVSEQFRTKLSTAVETAETNLEIRTVEDTEVTVLDTDAFTHRYEFPPTDLLLDELFRRADTSVLVGVADNELHLRTADPVDVHDLVESVRTEVPEAGLTAVSAHEGIVEYLAGERDAVLDAVLDDVVSRV